MIFTSINYMGFYNNNLACNHLTNFFVILIEAKNYSLDQLTQSYMLRTDNFGLCLLYSFSFNFLFLSHQFIIFFYAKLLKSLHKYYFRSKRPRKIMIYRAFFIIYLFNTNGLFTNFWTIKI